jgi:hypothetical protein
MVALPVAVWSPLSFPIVDLHVLDIMYLMRGQCCRWVLILKQSQLVWEKMERRYFSGIFGRPMTKLLK